MREEDSSLRFRPRDLEPFAATMSLGEQLEVKVVGLEKLIELKAAAGRPKDQMALPVLRATLAETRRRS